MGTFDDITEKYNVKKELEKYNVIEDNSNDIQPDIHPDIQLEVVQGVEYIKPEIIKSIPKYIPKKQLITVITPDGDVKMTPEELEKYEEKELKFFTCDKCNLKVIPYQAPKCPKCKSVIEEWFDLDTQLQMENEIQRLKRESKKQTAGAAIGGTIEDRIFNRLENNKIACPYCKQKTLQYRYEKCKACGQKELTSKEQENEKQLRQQEEKKRLDDEKRLQEQRDKEIINKLYNCRVCNKPIVPFLSNACPQCEWLQEWTETQLLLGKKYHLEDDNTVDVNDDLKEIVNAKKKNAKKKEQKRKWDNMTPEQKNEIIDARIDARRAKANAEKEKANAEKEKANAEKEKADAISTAKATVDAKYNEDVFDFVKKLMVIYKSHGFSDSFSDNQGTRDIIKQCTVVENDICKFDKAKSDAIMNAIDELYIKREKDRKIELERISETKI